MAAGADEAAFLAADRKVQTEFIPNLPGFVRRTTARGEDGRWLVATLWGWAEAADEADRLAQTAPETQALFALLDATSVERARFETLD